MSLLHHIPLKHKRTTLERAEKFISKHYFSDVNLQSKLHPEKCQLQEIKHFAAPGRVPFEQAVKGNFQPTSVGQSFGPVWSTHWFQINVIIPSSWVNKEVHFLWNSGSEALVWIDGKPCQGLNARNEKNYYILFEKLMPSQCEKRVTFYIEMACNTLFGIGSMARYDKEQELRKFTLSQAEIAVFDREVFSLIQDVECLHDVAKELGEDNRAYQALYTVNSILNIFATQDRSSWPKCRDLAEKFFRQKNGESQHTVYAMGHAHIDSAWLWPYAETIRKCARSWSCSIRLMEKYPNFKFCCSQAQQYVWVKEHYPSLWKEVCKFVAKGQFIPVGGTWVEMDGNIPSGEACIRQFLYGQEFFKKEFNFKCKEFWLPDTFGYSGQFPQILQHCGITRFLSQKLSWNLVNKFPHHTFHWEGIDGSTVLAHFPPGDSYEMSGTAKELKKSLDNFQDKGRCNLSAFLFGHGDGGHGPSEEMLGRLDRFRDCDGLPRIKLSGSDEFFSAIEQEGTDMLCKWRGELYLELHNGTYTTWAQVKEKNRKCEIALQNTEALCTMIVLEDKTFEYPYNELDRLWKLLLLNQFHDVLPGSSISQVFTDAMDHYKDIETSLSKLITVAKTAISKKLKRDTVYVMNNNGVECCGIYNFSSTAHKDGCEPSTKKMKLREPGLIRVPPFCIKPLKDCYVSPSQITDVVCTQEGDNFVLKNERLQAVIDPLGRVLSLKTITPGNSLHSSLSKETISQTHPANQFVLYDDIPLFWDAWDVMDYHLETRQPLCNVTQKVKLTNESSLIVTLSFTVQISEESHIQQTISLQSASPCLVFHTTVVWKENRKFLKVEFPTTVNAMEASYDIQSGFIRRPNHTNTTWDSAKFEVCGHKWADVSEHGFGVSVLNDSKYGYSAMDGILRLSLLRSPKGPDPTADMGTHSFRYALMPHVGSLQEAGVIQNAIMFNSGPEYFTPKQSQVKDSKHIQSLFESLTPQVVIQTVKMAEDRSPTVILRLHEAFGGEVRAGIRSHYPFKNIQLCNGLEENVQDEGQKLQSVKKATSHLEIAVTLKPFQIVTFRCKIN